MPSLIICRIVPDCPFNTRTASCPSNDETLKFTDCCTITAVSFPWPNCPLFILSSISTPRLLTTYSPLCRMAGTSSGDNPPAWNLGTYPPECTIAQLPPPPPPPPPP